MLRLFQGYMYSLRIFRSLIFRQKQKPVCVFAANKVGHTLGLRHNFEGSTLLTLEELQDPSKTAEVGLTSSVMDYLPLNIVSSKMQGAKAPHYFTPRVGEYDMWAIKYGYMAVGGEELLAEHEVRVKAQGNPESSPPKLGRGEEIR